MSNKRPRSTSSRLEVCHCQNHQCGSLTHIDEHGKTQSGVLVSLATLRRHTAADLRHRCLPPERDPPPPLVPIAEEPDEPLRRSPELNFRALHNSANVEPGPSRLQSTSAPAVTDSLSRQRSLSSENYQSLPILEPLAEEPEGDSLPDIPDPHRRDSDDSMHVEPGPSRLQSTPAPVPGPSRPQATSVPVVTDRFPSVDSQNPSDTLASWGNSGIGSAKIYDTSESFHLVHQIPFATLF